MWFKKMCFKTRFFAFIALLAAFSGGARGGKGTISGYMAGEFRLFPDDV